MKLLRTADFNLSSKLIYLKAQFDLSVDGLVVRLSVCISKVRCSNLHKVISFNYTYNKTCKSYINDCFFSLFTKFHYS